MTEQLIKSLDSCLQRIAISTEIQDETRVSLHNQGLIYAAFLSDYVSLKITATPDATEEMLQSILDFCTLIDEELKAQA